MARRPPAGEGRLDSKALCKALGISSADAATQTFLTLVEHDLHYLTDRIYRQRFDRQLEEQGLRKAKARKQANVERTRGRPADDVARSLVAMFINRLEGVLELQLGRGKGKLGFSKQGGRLRTALAIYLAAAGRSAPDRHMPRLEEPVWLSDAERARLAAPLAEPVTPRTTRRSQIRTLDAINKALTAHRRR